MNGDLNEPAYTSSMAASSPCSELRQLAATTCSQSRRPTPPHGGPVPPATTTPSSSISATISATASSPRQLHLEEEPRRRLQGTPPFSKTPAFASVPSLPHLDYASPPPTSATRLPSTPPTSCSIGTGGEVLLQQRRPDHLLRGLAGSAASIVEFFEAAFPFSPQLGYNPTGPGDFATLSALT